MNQVSYYAQTRDGKFYRSGLLIQVMKTFLYFNSAHLVKIKFFHIFIYLIVFTCLSFKALISKTRSKIMKTCRIVWVRNVSESKSRNRFQNDLGLRRLSFLFLCFFKNIRFQIIRRNFFLLFHSSILKPDLDLTFREPKHFRQRYSARSTNVPKIKKKFYFHKNDILFTCPTMNALN